MTKLKLSRRNNLALLIFLWPAWLHAVAAGGGDYNLTKCLVGASGVNQVTSADYSSAFSAGEDVAGTESQNAPYDFVSGYFSGYASGIGGTFNLLGITVGTTHILQNGLQVGVPLNAMVQVAFSAPLDPTTIANGIQVTMIMDHLGQAENSTALWSSTYDVTGTTVIISPQGAWPGNTLFNIAGTASLRSIDGFALSSTLPAQFISVLDPHEENVILQPIPIAGIAQTISAGNAASLNLDIPADALSDYSYVLVSQDPFHSPLLVNPNTLQIATQKAQASGGAYQTPLALEEIVAYNEQGGPVSLSKSANLTVSYGANQGMVNGTSLPIRADTLAFWTLDSTHALWVKMPDSQANGSAVIGQLSQFSVYALMGGAESNASDVYVFPVPWRPHGPNAGTGAGETGTDTGGMTFSNLPSECSIKIYTLSGELVRQIQHSDLSGSVGQEKWDGNTSGGNHAASGVYLWRVESATDGKNGKLMVIR
jgi:hypothetical protein